MCICSRRVQFSKACWKTTATSPTKNSIQCEKLQKSLTKRTYPRKDSWENLKVVLPNLMTFFRGKSKLDSAHNPTNIYAFFFHVKLLSQFVHSDMKNAVLTTLSKNCPPFEFFPVKIRETENFNFSKSSDSNWSSRDI